MSLSLKNSKESLSIKEDELEDMVRQKTISTIGVVVAIVIGWDKIVSFVNSFLIGVNNVLKSIPPIILLGLLVWLIIWLGKTKH